MKTSSDIEKQLQELKPVLAKKFKVKEIGVFGSFSKGEQSDKSDIDILVDLQEPLGWAFFELKDFLESRLNRSVDLVTRNALKKQLKDSILSQTNELKEPRLSVLLRRYVGFDASNFGVY